MKVTIAVGFAAGLEGEAALRKEYPIIGEEVWDVEITYPYDMPDHDIMAGQTEQLPYLTGELEFHKEAQ